MACLGLKRSGLVIPALILASPLVFLWGPHQLSDWFWRPQFVQACVFGAGGRIDDSVLRGCNAAWDRHVIVAANGWRPEQP